MRRDFYSIITTPMFQRWILIAILIIGIFLLFLSKNQNTLSILRGESVATVGIVSQTGNTTNNSEELLREQLREKADYVVEDAVKGEVYITITDTEHCNRYRDKEYGFALTFPPRKEGNTCKVLKRISLADSGAISIDFEFLLPDDPQKGNGLLSNPTVLYTTPLFIFDPEDENYDTGPIPVYGRYASFGLVIMNEQAYNDSHRDDGIGGRERMEQNIIGTNNQYYFLTWQYPEYSYFKLGYGSGDSETDIGQRYTTTHIVIFDVE